MNRVFERRSLRPQLIFNLEDAYARKRLGPRSHPRPIEPMRFWLAARLAPGDRQDYEPPRELVIRLNPSGYHLFFNLEKREDGSTRRLELAEGTYLIRVTSPLYQTDERPMRVPMPDLNNPDPGNPDPMSRYTFELQPGFAYPFPDPYPLRPQDSDDCREERMLGRRGPTLLRGSLHTPAGQGIAGAKVRVVDVTKGYQTDESGQWVLWFPDEHPSGAVIVHVERPGQAAVDVPNVCVVRGRENSLAETALRGWVLQRGVGVRAASVAVSGQPVPTVTAADGSWFYYFDLNQASETVSVTATLPANGPSLTATDVRVRPRGTVVVTTFQF